MLGLSFTLCIEEMSEATTEAIASVPGILQDTLPDGRWCATVMPRPSDYHVWPSCSEPVEYSEEPSGGEQYSILG